MYWYLGIAEDDDIDDDDEEDNEDAESYGNSDSNFSESN